MTILFAHFDTAVGRCAIAWSARGVVGVQLPEANQPKTRSRVLQRFPNALETVPPPEVAAVRDALAGLLRGLPSDLSFVRLDMDALPPFHRRVYEAARAIPWGATTTYGDLEKVAGATGAAPRRGASSCTESVRTHCAVPSLCRGWPQDRRFFGAWRHHDEAPASRD